MLRATLLAGCRPRHTPSTAGPNLVGPRPAAAASRGRIPCQWSGVSRYSRRLRSKASRPEVTGQYRPARLSPGRPQSGPAHVSPPTVYSDSTPKLQPWDNSCRTRSINPPPKQPPSRLHHRRTAQRPEIRNPEMVMKKACRGLDGAGSRGVTTGRGTRRGGSGRAIMMDGAASRLPA